MNKQKLVELIKHPSQIGETELKSLETLAANFPYCQFLKALSARAHKNCHTEQESKRVALAAVYTTNRSILKDFLEAQEFPVHETPVKSKEDRRNIVAIQKAPAPEEAKENVLKEPLELVKEVEAKREDTPLVAENKDLENTSSIDTSEKIVKEEAAPQVDDSDTITYSKPAEDENKDEIYKEIQANLERLRKQRSILGIDDDEATGTQEDPVAEVEAGKKSDIKPEETISDAEGKGRQEEIQYYIPEEEEDKIIAELSTKEEVSKDQLQIDRQKQQFEIIDRFIQTNPSITRFGLNNKVQQEEQEDLSEKLLDTGNQLVSENLAIILTKQNKIEKAIDIYKKLIWKFPQKKAYFAQKIEELKNT